MLCDAVSYYHDQIDEMIFFQDNNLEKIEIINHYNDLIAQHNYTEANEYMDQQEGVYGYFACYWNSIENRIDKLQKYLLDKPFKKQPFIYYDNRDYFYADDLHIFSDTDEEENFLSVSLFSDDNEQEFMVDFYVFSDDEASPPGADEDTIWI